MPVKEMPTTNRSPLQDAAKAKTSRRRFLGAAAAGAAATAVGPRLAFANPTDPTQGDALVVIFLRGGMDGLSMTPPYGYQSYRDLRPTIAIPPPGEAGGALPLTSGSAPTAAFPTGLDGVIGLNPAMAPIHETLWANGQLAIVPAVGLPREESRTRSHFSAELYWERGSASSSIRTGWLNRVLALQAGNPPLPGVGKSSQALDILKGPAKTISIPDLRNFGIGGFRNGGDARAALNAMYGGGGAINATGADVLSVVDQLDALNADTGPGYPGGRLGRDLSQTATLLKSGLGLRAAAIDFGGWDHHGELGAPGDTDGRFYRRANELALSLRAFTDDLGPDAMAETSIVVITEFGRTINENGSQGTDHGRGTTIMAMGGNIAGGVYGYDYPDVIEDDPQDGDLTVLTDFRQPVAEILSNRVGLGSVGSVFPTFTPGTALGIA